MVGAKESYKQCEFHIPKIVNVSFLLYHGGDELALVQPLIMTGFLPYAK